MEGQFLLLVLLLAPLTAACRAERYMSITSAPPGAAVRLDDQPVGVTPVRVPFEHYGTRRLTFYLPGYRTASRKVRLRAPWHARFPVDILTEVLLPLGLTDRRRVHEELVPGQEVMSGPSLRSVIERANFLRQSGPEGPRDLPELTPAIVPSEPEPPPGADAETPEPDSQGPRLP